MKLRNLPKTSSRSRSISSSTSSHTSHTPALQQSHASGSSSQSDHGHSHGSPLHFYRNRTVEKYAEKTAYTVGLGQFVQFGKGMNQERLIKGGNFLRTELPVRLAHRLRDLQSLPFIVGLHPNLAKVYGMYVSAFERIRQFPAIRNMEDNDKFCKFMKGLLNEHTIVIPQLAVGIAESAPNFTPSQLDAFMTRMLRSRISRRVLTEQHIALSEQVKSRKEGKKSDDRFIGIVDTKLNPAEVVRKCDELLIRKMWRRLKGRQMNINVDGSLDQTFVYIPDHLEYMIFELLKNSAHATLLRHPDSSEPLPPINITISSSPLDISIRISDQGGGIPYTQPLPHPSTSSMSSHTFPTSSSSLASSTSTNQPLSGGTQHRGLGESPYFSASAARRDVFSFAHSHGDSEAVGLLKTVERLTGTVKEQVSSSSSLPSALPSSLPPTRNENGDAEQEEDIHLGIGLPLSMIFAEYFGGSLEMYSMVGYGNDAYLRIPRVGNRVEASCS